MSKVWDEVNFLHEVTVKHRGFLQSGTTIFGEGGQAFLESQSNCRILNREISYWIDFIDEDLYQSC